MKVRNVKLNELNEIERQIVEQHYKDVVETTDCKCKTLEIFWENHREADTDNGNYNGWISKEEQERDCENTDCYKHKTQSKDVKLCILTDEFTDDEGNNECYWCENCRKTDSDMIKEVREE